MRQNNVAFIRSNGRWLSAGFLLTFLSSFGQTNFIGLSGNDLRTAHALSGGQFGMLYMAATLASALTLPWLGRTLDLMPGWKVVRFTMPALALACVLIALAPNAVVLLVALYLLRLFGQGMMIETALTETSRWFVANRGRAMALIVQGQQLGSAVFPTLVVMLHRASGDWRLSWFAAAALLAIMLPLVIHIAHVPRNPQLHETQMAVGQTVRDWTPREVIGDPIFYLLLAGTLAPTFIGTVIFFHQGYLVELRGYDPLAFAVAFPVMAVSTVFSGVWSGHLIDRLGALRLLPFALVPLCTASLAVAWVTPLWGIYIFMFLLGISSGLTGTLFGVLWPEVYGLANLGSIRALTVSAMVLASAVGPGLTGWLIDAGIDLPRQMRYLAGWCVAASFLLALAVRQIHAREAWRRVAG